MQSVIDTVRRGVRYSGSFQVTGDPMKRAVLVVAVMMAAGPALAAAEKETAARPASELADALRTMSAVIDALGAADARTRDAHDAPQRLADALARGSATTEDAAVITRWILEAKEEAVARGLRDALGAADFTGAGPGGERWNPVTGAMVALFQSALEDAEAHRSRDLGDWPELNALVRAAAPAVAASLREADPATREQLLLLVRAAAAALAETAPRAPAGRRR